MRKTLRARVGPRPDSAGPRGRVSARARTAAVTDALRMDPNEVEKAPDALRDAPDGRQHRPDALHSGPDGRKHRPDASRSGPDGRKHRPDALHCGPEARKHRPDASRDGPDAVPDDRYGRGGGPDACGNAPEPIAPRIQMSKVPRARANAACPALRSRALGSIALSFFLAAGVAAGPVSAQGSLAPPQALPQPPAAQAQAKEAPADHPVLLERTTERGPVRVRVTLDPAQPVIGDALTLTLEVLAEPGVELLMPAFGQSLDRFAIREFVPGEGIDEAGKTLATQRYILSAPRSGPQYVPPIAIEFVDRRPGMRPAPEGEDAYEVLTDRIDFEVRSVLPAASAGDLDPPLDTLAPLPAGVARGPRVWMLGLVAGVLAAAALVLWRWLAAGKTGRPSPYEVALSRLEALRARPRPEGPAAVDAFFVELSDLVRHYLEDRFGLQAPELTTEEFMDVAAGAPDLSHEHQGFLQDFLRRADQVKFARHLPEAGYVEEVLLAAGRFLEQTRPADRNQARRDRDLPPSGRSAVPTEAARA